MKSNYYRAFKISLVFFIINSLYIVFSDKIILLIAGNTASVETLSKIQTFKGIAFVIVISVILFILILKELNTRRKYLQELEKQKEALGILLGEKNKIGVELEERNEYIETVLKNIPLGIAVYRVDSGKVLVMNKNFWEICGWPPKELNKFDLFYQCAFPDEEYRNEIKSRIAEYSKNNRSEQLNFVGIEIVTKKGQKKTINVQTIPVPDNNAAITTIQDVTEQFETRKILIENETKFASLFNNNPTPIIFSRFEDGVIFEVNEAFTRLFGSRREELVNRSTTEIPIWKNPSERKEVISEILKKGVIEDKEIQLVKKSGETIDTLTFMQIAELSGEQMLITIILDITSKKKKDHQIRESKALLEKTINNLHEAVFVINPENRKITLANAAVETVFGYKTSEVLGKSTEFLHLNADMYKKFAMAGDPALEEHGEFHTEFQMKRKDGEVIETENTVSAISDEKGWYSGVVSVIRDVTERKQTERRLYDYQESLKKMTTELSLIEEKQRKEFAADIHDHLSQLLVISQMKMNDLKNQLQKENKQQLETISKHIAEALDNSRQITYDLSPPVLYELGLVETMYWLIDKLNDEQDINADFITNIETVELPESKLILIYRVIQELVSNALKHAEAEMIEIVFKAKHDLLEIYVEDDGKGFRVNGSENTKFKKGGFGLFAVKERVSNMGGDFSVNSKTGVGTSVKITVPLNNIKEHSNGTKNSDS